MDNSTYKMYVDRINSADLEELKSLYKTFDDTLNDPFDDGTDKGGDIAISNLSSICFGRIQELEKKENPK